jgi:hypothetical protein
MRTSQTALVRTLPTCFPSASLGATAHLLHFVAPGNPSADSGLRLTRLRFAPPSEGRLRMGTVKPPPGESCRGSVSLGLVGLC